MGGTKATNDMKLVDEGLVWAVSEFRHECRKAGLRCALHRGMLCGQSVNSLRLR